MANYINTTYIDKSIHFTTSIGGILFIRCFSVSGSDPATKDVD